MGTIISKEFDIELHNLPAVNIRNEFNLAYDFLATHNYRDIFITESQQHHIQSVIWHARPGAFLATLIMRALLGIESYVCYATLLEIGKHDLLSRENIDYTKNPFLFKNGGTADKYYNQLPGIINSKLSLEHKNKAVWNKTKILYREIRNPIFHGYEVGSSSFTGTLKCYDHIADMHKWIDSWHANDLLPPVHNPYK